MKVKTINQTDLWELQDHRDNTAWELIKCYTLWQLSIMDGITRERIKTCWKYLPVRMDTYQALVQYKLRKKKKPYMTAWIRMDEIKYMFSKMNKWKRIVVESEN